MTKETSQEKEETGESTLDKILKSYPKIEASYDEIHAEIHAKASVENGKLTKMELIYKGETLEEETKTSNLTEEQTFYVKEYGIGWYKVKVTSEIGEGTNKITKSRMAWVKVTNVSNALIPPVITIEPNVPNGNNKWYKRGEDDKEITLRVTIETNSPSADRIMYISSGAHNETRDESNPSIRKNSNI